MTYLALVIVLALLAGAVLLAQRARQRAGVSTARLQETIVAGTQVMTTSGLYGTVVAVNSDDTVILSIAPGIEVRWAFAALRDAAALPPRYRGPVSPEADGGGPDAAPPGMDP